MRWCAGRRCVRRQGSPRSRFARRRGRGGTVYPGRVLKRAHVAETFRVARWVLLPVARLGAFDRLAS